MGIVSPLKAQFAYKTPPNDWQTELTKRYSNLRNSTLRLARQHNWPLHKNYSNHRVLKLQSIDTLGQPIYYTLHNAEAARGTQTQALYGTGSLPIALSGNSAIMAGRLGLWDGGRARESHQEFVGTGGGTARIVQKDNVTTLNNHTTHLAGTLIARGINEEAKGMANGAPLSVWDYTDDMTELITAAPTLLLSNHSYGPVVGWVYNASRPGTDSKLKWEWWGNPAISATEDYLFGFYTTNARDLDRIAYNNPFFLMVRSADNKRSETGPPTGTPYFLKNTAIQSTLVRSRNDSYDVIPAEATAKNVLTVGAADVSFTSPNQPTLVGSTDFSGWGPTDDGRIKPDLLGFGSDVLSSLATTDTAYGTYSGTSMASANVSGSLFLLQELYARQRSPGLPTSGQFMRAATLRGLALHTATRINPAAGPDYRQGWGLLNTEAAARLLLNENLAHLVLEKTLTPGVTLTQSVVAQGNEPLVVTLCWTDPEGTATSVAAGSLNNRTPKLVNDLDLRLHNGQQTDFPFVLDPAQPAQAATRGDNFRDNIEQVYIANPVAGQTYTFTVSYKGKMTYSSQPFSVIVSGLYRTSCSLAVSIQPAQDTTICSGMILPLHASTESIDVRYQWLRNGVNLTNTTTAVYQVTQAGSYILRVTDSKGCSATSQPVQVHLRSQLATMTPNGDQWLCDSKQTVHLKTTPASGIDSAGVLIDWLLNGSVLAGAHSPTLTVTQPGRYQVRVTQAGCPSLSTETNVLFASVSNLNLVPAETELTLPQGAAVTLKAPVDASYRYQWYRNDQELPNAHTYQLSVTQAGSYKVQVIQQGCVGWSTARLVQTTVLTATAPDPISQFTFYPNPTEHSLSIRYTNPLAKQVQVSVFDLLGVLQQQPVSLKPQNGQVEGNLSIQQLPSGTYILLLSDGITTQTERFIKK